MMISAVARRAKNFRALSVAMMALALSSCASDSRPLHLVDSVDLQRYAGRWYIIANIPYFAERGNVGSYFEVNFKPDGHLTDIYYGKSHSFDAKTDSFTMNGYVVPGTGNAKWRESPFWPLYFTYPILYVDPAYQYALVGYPGQDYGWVLAREPRIDGKVYQSLLARFKDQGYDVSQFKLVPQGPEQLGQPGYQ